MDEIERQEFRERHRARMRALSEFWTIKDFATVARVSVRTLHRLRERRPDGFPQEFRPSGHRVLFKKSEVLAWIEAQPLW